MRRAKGTVRAICAWGLGLCLMPHLTGHLTGAGAVAHDLAESDNSPEIRQWVMNLHNGNGIGCCATADGWKPELVEWDITRQGYRVMIEGHWIDVPPQAVIEGPNKLGHAEVWYYHIDGLPAVRCFLPGEGM